MYYIRYIQDILYYRHRSNDLCVFCELHQKIAIFNNSWFDFGNVVEFKSYNKEAKNKIIAMVICFIYYIKK